MLSRDNHEVSATPVQSAENLSLDKASFTSRSTHTTGGVAAKLALLAALLAGAETAEANPLQKEAAIAAKVIPLAVSLQSISSSKAKDDLAKLESDFRKDKDLKKYLDGLFNLAQLIEQSGLSKPKPEDLYEKALEAASKDPRYVQYTNEAHKRLGHIEVDGKWYKNERAAKEAERELKERLDQIERNRQQGLFAISRYPELQNEIANQREVSTYISAHTKEAGELAQAAGQKMGVELHVAIAPHSVIVCQRPDSEAVALAQIAEYVYRRLNSITFGKFENNTFALKNAEAHPFSGKHVYFLVEGGAYSNALNFLAAPGKFRLINDNQIAFIRRYDPDPQNNPKGLEPVPGWSLDGQPSPGVVVPLHVQRDINTVTSTAANGMGHFWVHYSARSAMVEKNIATNTPLGNKEEPLTMLDWLSEGMGIWASIDTIGVNRFYRTQPDRYGGQGGLNTRDVGNEFAKNAYLLARDAEKDPQTPRMLTLSRKSTRGLESKDLTMAWSVVDYLIRARTEDWKGFIEKLNSKGSFRVAFIAQFGSEEDKSKLNEVLQTKNESALDMHLYRHVCESFEKEWRAWVLKEYKSSFDNPLLPMPPTPFTPFDEEKRSSENR